MNAAIVAAYPASWTLPGCGPDCRPRQHDPRAHERYGELRGRLGSHRGVVSVGPLAVDLDAQAVAVAGTPVHPSPTEWRLLAALAGNAGRLVVHDELMAAGWGRTHPEAAAGERADRQMLRINVYRLRRRLGVAGGLIVNVGCRGYRLEDPAAISSVDLPPRPAQRWARDWDRCQHCRTTDRPHNGRGLCMRCYWRQRHAGKLR